MCCRIAATVEYRAHNLLPTACCVSAAEAVICAHVALVPTAAGTIKQYTARPSAVNRLDPLFTMSGLRLHPGTSTLTQTLTVHSKHVDCKLHRQSMNMGTLPRVTRGAWPDVSHVFRCSVLWIWNCQHRAVWVCWLWIALLHKTLVYWLASTIELEMVAFCLASFASDFIVGSCLYIYNVHHCCATPFSQVPQHNVRGRLKWSGSRTFIDLSLPVSFQCSSDLCRPVPQ